MNRMREDKEKAGETNWEPEPKEWDAIEVKPYDTYE